MEKIPSYITTTLPYVNADPHLGHAMEFIRADAVARYHRYVLGRDVFFNTGTDEHGAKIYEAARAAGEEPQAYADRYAARFEELLKALNISEHHFIRTTDEQHVRAAEEMWRRCDANGFIYLKNYRVKYCVGCELEKTDSELENGRCPIHPNREIEIREEENYFFKWSAFRDKLLEFYAGHPDFVIPDFRFNEVKAFVERGLEDFSISRLKEKMPWGVPVPDDENHVMYVWFDALASYISTLGWPDDQAMFERFWKGGSPIQYCGKDNNRQQSAMWQSMLMAADLPNTGHVVINGFITSGGEKMSKSVGNVVDPMAVLEYFKPYTPFPEDVLRFVLLHDVPAFEDGDVTMESIKQSYEGHLQNGLGNLVSRIMKMATSNDVAYSVDKSAGTGRGKEESFDHHAAMEHIWESISRLDEEIQAKEPFKLIKTDKAGAELLIAELVQGLWRVGERLKPFLPRTAAEIERLIESREMPKAPLFNRLNA